MKSLLFFILVLMISCNQQESKKIVHPLDEVNGFQDIKLGNNPTVYSSRTTLKNEMINPNDFYWIVKINDSIEPHCRMGEYARVYGFKNKISTIEFTVSCPNLISIYKSKFGEPLFDGVNYKWQTEKNILIIEPSEDMKRDYKVVRYVSIPLTLEREKAQKGNL